MGWIYLVSNLDSNPQPGDGTGKNNDAAFGFPNAMLDSITSAQNCGLIVLDIVGNVRLANTEAGNWLDELGLHSKQCKIESIPIPVLGSLFRSTLESPGKVTIGDLNLEVGNKWTQVRLKTFNGAFGETEGVIVLLHDARSERELDRMKADFLSTVSHELRTPLTSILGYSSLLIDAADFIEPEDRIQFLQTIDLQGRKLLELINDLIEMAKLDSETLVLDKEWCEPWTIIDSVCSECRPKAEAKQIQLTADLPQLALETECDTSRIRQALAYLVDNAVKFTPEGGTIKLSASEAGGFCTFAVIDNGMGISPEHLPRIFERFYQIDSGADRKSNGTGLGLAIVKKVCELHGGSVFVESVLQEGSTFGFRLPCQPVKSQTYDEAVGEACGNLFLVGQEATPVAADLSSRLDLRVVSKPAKLRELGNCGYSCYFLIDVGVAASHPKLYLEALNSLQSTQLPGIFCGRADTDWVQPFSIQCVSLSAIGPSLLGYQKVFSSKDAYKVAMLDGGGEPVDQLQRTLEESGLETATACSKFALQKLLETNAYNLIVAGAGGSLMDDLSICRNARKQGYLGGLILVLDRYEEQPEGLAVWLHDWARSFTTDEQTSLVVAAGLAGQIAGSSSQMPQAA